LRVVKVAIVLDTGRPLDTVGVVEQDAEVANAADAGFGTDGRLAGFDARIAEDALSRPCRFSSCSKSSCTGNR
jgi:hypothetical protein